MQGSGTASRAGRSQKAGVLATLVLRGVAGLSSVEMVRGAVDGRPILNYAARIEELRRDGHRIDTHREPNNTARYVLIASPITQQTTASTSHAPPEPLADVPRAPRSAVLGWEVDR